MKPERRRSLDGASWVPLRSCFKALEVGEYGYEGYEEEYFGAGSVAVPLNDRALAENLGWEDIGIASSHAPATEDDSYVPADVYHPYKEDFLGTHLVLEQRPFGSSPSTWHLHQDLVLGLNLEREGDVWVSREEGYEPVARLVRTPSGAPALLEMRAEHLKDFLAAKGCGLYVTIYRSRTAIFGSLTNLGISDNEAKDSRGERWELWKREIHEGGHAFGSTTSVIQMGRTDVSEDDDVPVIGFPAEGEITSDSWTIEHDGRKLYLICGELWRNEWVQPGIASPRVRGDRIESRIEFVIEADGRRAAGSDLIESGRWLWFRPEVVMALAHRRGGSLEWYTRHTGRIACSPSHGVVFGVNRVGLINVYAKDIAKLPEWQQRVWVGWNVTPEGGVSKELLDSQARAEPADTQAPEAFLGRGLDLLNKASERRLGFQLLRPHDQVPQILARVHRFRAVDQTGFFALAKDLARLTSDSFDAGAILQYLKLSKSEKVGSLKAVEKLLSQRLPALKAREVMAPLVGIYELRHADAHLASRQLDESLRLVGIDSSMTPLEQGCELLDSCVTSIYMIKTIIEHWESGVEGEDRN